MTRNQVRASQIITTFGPGSMVDFPDAAVLVAGLDHWHFANAPEAVHEPRLVAKLRQLLSVPDLGLRLPPTSVEEPAESHRDVVGWRFPNAFIVQRGENSPRGRRRRLVPASRLEGGAAKFRDPDHGLLPVVPIRFVRACRKGHIGDVDWRAFVHPDRKECGRDLWVEERGSSGELEDVFVVCECGDERTMSHAARRELRALGSCNGSRPWLGAGTREACGEPNRLLVRSASNAWFPQLFPVISIPDAAGPLDDIVRELWEDFFSDVMNEGDLARLRRKPSVRDRIERFDDAAVFRSVARVRGGGGAFVDRPVKEVEFEALSEARDELGSEEADGDFHARVLAPEAWRGPRTEPIERVVLVHRLREVVALVGFTRFEAAGPDIRGELSLDVRRAPLAVNARWLPAIENRGEGVFVQFRPEAIGAWLALPAVVERGRRLEAGFEEWKREHEAKGATFPGLPYYLLHSFSHLLMTAISLECGYPASSLRERVYSLPSGYGVLVYTGSPDAEGTLGGLVLAGRDFSRHMHRALEAGALCSGDPVCSFHDPSAMPQSRLLGSACHGCLLVPETSCEMHNDYLDRALVVQTLESGGAELFPGGSW